MELLNENGEKMQLFEEQIKIDPELPKFISINEYKKALEASGETADAALSKGISAPESSSAISYEDLKGYFLGKDDGLKLSHFNVTVSEKMRKILDETTMGSTLLNFNPRTSFGDDRKKTKSVWGKLAKMVSDKVKSARENKFDVIAFFSNVKKLANESDYKDRIADYVENIGYAEKLHQTAMKEKLFNSLVINKYESILYANGMYKCIDEKHIVEFAKNCPRNIKIDYIGNYMRAIPNKALKDKFKADELEVFDNYVILHYDPDDTGSSKTNKEKREEVRKSKDPILFGVISGSRKLYFIADWIDEYCDLTFDDFVEKFGEEEIRKGYISGEC